MLTSLHLVFWPGSFSFQMVGSATEATAEPVVDSPTADQLRFEDPLQLP